MQRTLSAIAAFGLTALALPALADGHGLTDEKVAAIEAKLAEMECQMDPDDIEVEDDGYDLDDVICKGGNQFDIKLDLDLNEVERLAE
jgi:hypothetical protein